MLRVGGLGLGVDKHKAFNNNCVHPLYIGGKAGAPTYILTSLGAEGRIDDLITITSPGLFDGTNLVYTYQWKRDSVNIEGQTTTSYTITALDLAPAILSCTITATNSCGEDSFDLIVSLDA